jgi:hypothetical protein
LIVNTPPGTSDEHILMVQWSYFGNDTPAPEVTIELTTNSKGEDMVQQPKK